MTKNELSTFTGPVLFSASWCSPCKTLKTQLKAANVEVETIVVDEDAEGMDIAKENSVRTVPTAIVFEDGKATKVMNGVQDILSHFLHLKKS